MKSGSAKKTKGPFHVGRLLSYKERSLEANVVRSDALGPLTMDNYKLSVQDAIESGYLIQIDGKSQLTHRQTSCACMTIMETCEKSTEQ